jgi:c-di-GMP-binding flagellar brake protein YcgR
MGFNLNLENILYMKIMYKDASGNFCPIKSAIKSINEKEMLICSKYIANLEIEVPQEIMLSIICNDGLYKTKAQLRRLENEEPYAFWFVQTPQGLEYQQNREYFRIIADYECIYSLKNGDNLKEIFTKTINISANGVSIFSEEYAVSTQDAVLLININGRKIQTKVKFIRSEKIDDCYKLSFKFTDMNENDRDFISQTCIKKQLEDRRNALM